MATAYAQQPAPDIISRLQAAVGPDHVRIDEAERRFYGTDVYRAGHLPAAVVAPGSVEELQAVVRACHATRTPITVRGSGASYTDGYTYAAQNGVTISTERLDRIVAIDEGNATVTVEAGCTWKTLHEALRSRGWRTPFWGPSAAWRPPSAAA